MFQCYTAKEYSLIILAYFKKTQHSSLKSNLIKLFLTFFINFMDFEFLKVFNHKTMLIFYIMLYYHQLNRLYLIANKIQLTNLHKLNFSYIFKKCQLFLKQLLLLDSYPQYLIPSLPTYDKLMHKQYFSVFISFIKYFQPFCNLIKLIISQILSNKSILNYSSTRLFFNDLYLLILNNYLKYFLHS